MKEHCNCSQSLMYIHAYIHTWGRAGQTFVKVRAPPVAILLFHLISSHHSLGTACGDTVFCCSGTASGDPCHFISPHHFCGHRLWRLSFLVCHTVSCMSGTIRGNSFMSFEFFASFVWAPPVATQFSVLYIIYYIHTHTQT